MRHFMCLAHAPGPLARRVTARPAKAQLVAPAGAAQRLAPAKPRAPPGAVNVAPVTAPAHLHLQTATPAVVQPMRRFGHRRHARVPRGTVFSNSGLSLELSGGTPVAGTNRSVEEAASLAVWFCPGRRGISLPALRGGAGGGGAPRSSLESRDVHAARRIAVKSFWRAWFSSIAARRSVLSRACAWSLERLTPGRRNEVALGRLSSFSSGVITSAWR